MGTESIALKIARNGITKYPTYSGSRRGSNPNFQDYNLEQILNQQTCYFEIRLSDRIVM